MATLSQAKTLGGVGAILVFIPFISIVGYILIIVAVKQISDDLQDKGIFRNIVVAASTGIVGALAAAFVFLAGATGNTSTVVTSELVNVAAELFVAWIFLVVSAVFLRRAYGEMAQQLGVGTFKTSGTLYLVGAALAIVGIGFVLLLIAQILQAVAYFSIPSQPPSQTAGVPTGPEVIPPSMAPPAGVTKFCTSCGTKISPTATFCYSCGAKQQ
jgi:uncharacterized membrane protein